MVKKIKKMDYQKKSNYFWTVVFGVIVVLIITFSIKLIPDILTYMSDNRDKTVSTSDSSTSPEEDIFRSKVSGMENFVNSLEIDDEPTDGIFKFGFLVNVDSKDLIFSVTDPVGNKYNTWEKTIPDFAKVELYSDGFYVLTVDWKKAKMTVGKYEITAYGENLNSFVAVQV